MSFTYDQLKQAIQDYTENTETTFVNNLDIFIENAEERILKSVNLEVFRKNQSGNLTASTEYLSAPTDFLSPYSLSITKNGSKEFLSFKDVNFVQSFAPNPSTTGVPRYYALFDVDNFIVGPTPDDSYDVEIHYFYRPASLTAGAGSGTTWLSENTPVALLYGSLIEAYTFMKGEQDLVQNYTQRFIEALNRVKNLGEAQETNDDYRRGVMRVQRT